MPALTDKGRSMYAGGLAWGSTNSGKSFAIAHHALDAYLDRPGRHLLTGVNIKLLQQQIIPHHPGRRRRLRGESRTVLVIPWHDAGRPIHAHRHCG